MKKFLKWSVTPIGANRIESTFWRRLYWVVCYAMSLYAFYRQMEFAKREIKNLKEECIDCHGWGERSGCPHCGKYIKELV